jgi:hypothetical protein
MAEQVLTKAVGDTIRVSVDVAVRDIPEASFTGFRVVYPAELMVPIGTGSGNAVQHENGNLWAGKDVEVVANNHELDGAHFVYVSKMLKTGDQTGQLSGEVLTLMFQSLAHGVGNITITECKYGRMVDGVPQEYPVVVEGMALTLQAPVVLNPLASFTIRVV